MKTLERRLGLIVAIAFIVSALTIGSAVVYTQPGVAKPETTGLWQWTRSPSKGHGNTKVAGLWQWIVHADKGGGNTKVA